MSARLPALAVAGLVLSVVVGSGGAASSQALPTATTTATAPIIPIAATTIDEATSTTLAVPSDGDPAEWDIDREHPPTPGATTFTALVSRLNCSDGVTGRVLTPTVVRETDRIIVTFEVAPLSPGAHSCPGNDRVAYPVDLGEPIGARSLIDGWCLRPYTPGSGRCPDGGVRWIAVQAEPAGPTPQPAEVAPARPARPSAGRPAFTG